MLAQQLVGQPSVEWVEPNYLISRADITPNDARFGEQWALGNGNGQSGGGIAAPLSWKRTTGSIGTVIAVIDSGVDFTHPDLTGNQWTNRDERANHRDDDHDGYTDDFNGWDWVADGNRIRDEQGHGTSVAGIIAAEGNNAVGTTGVMWRAGLMSLRVLDATGTGDLADAVEAIDYAVAHGARVINLSWGLEAQSQALHDAIERASFRGVLVVCSAGNNGRNLDGQPYYPASFNLPNIIAVGATDSGDNLTSWSNWGATSVTVAAPGTDILTTRRGGDYHAVTGTSAAAPLVTGIAGLLRTAHPYLNAAETRASIVSGTRQVAGLSGKVAAGGVTDAAASLIKAGDMGTGTGNGNGNGSGNGNGNGDNGNGQPGNNDHGGNGGGHSQSPVPGRPERGGGGRGPGGSFHVTPPKVIKGAPGGNLPNLDEVRKLKSHVPQPPAAAASTTISANQLCADCDPGTGVGYVPPGDALYATARTEPRNETGQAGVDLGSQNFNWSTSLLALTGRAGLDLGLSLSYNSLVWTKQNQGIKFNADRGFPGPGFRLGFPTVQPRFYNSLRGASAYMMVTPSGGRVEMRQLGGADSYSNTYEAADGSNLQLVEYYQIVARHSGKCLDVSNAGLENFARLVQRDCAGGGNQQWQLVPTGDGYYRIMARHSAKTLDVEGASSADGATVHQWDYVGGANQQWQLVPTDSGYVRIVARHSGKVLDVGSISMDNGASVVQWSYAGGANQQWQLAPVSGQMVVRTPDGTQHAFAPSANGEYRCTQIKDRNGNYLTISHDALGHPTSVVDTLGRTVNFNYDGNQNLASITQIWNGAQHTWASFAYASVYLQGNFPGLSVNAPNNSYITVLKQVWQHDGSRHEFDYTSWGQVNRITKHAADGHTLNYTSYNLPVNSGWGQTDCPRFTERRDWAESWNNGAEAVTSYAVAGDGSWSQLTTPDGTVHKEFFATAATWQRGLTTRSETWAGGTLRKWSDYYWSQDDESLSYQQNPRLFDVSIYDAEGNRRRIWTGYTSFNLPSDIVELDSDGTTNLRHTHFDYNLSLAYTERRVLGLVKAKTVYDRGNLTAKTDFHYDWGGDYFSSQSPSVQHDGGAYHAGFLTGRGNLSAVRRFNKDAPNDENQAQWQQIIGYNAAGLPVWEDDGEWHRTSFSYADAFVDGVNTRNTLAYPTKLTDADGHSSTTEYNYDTGAVTRTEGPPPAGQTQGAIQTMQYDGVGRIERATIVNNGAYTRWVYPASLDYVQSFSTINSLQSESYSITYVDGAGRPRASAQGHPGSVGGYSAVLTSYDAMGRAVQQTKPTEISASWSPAGDDAGWVYTSQQYDWQGRPTLTTLPGGATTEVSYGGCGCAGGEVTTVRDERGRRKRYTKDALGRVVKVEELNWDQSVYATTRYAYNTHDRITSINGAGQVRSMDYDGHGRLWRRTTPEQGVTTYSYNRDDTLQATTDARGVTTAFVYNNRHQVKNINYSVPANSEVTATSNVTFNYDAVGNRTAMSNGVELRQYAYDQLSRLTHEDINFPGLDSNWRRISYGYNPAGQATRVTNPWGSEVAYGHDSEGQATQVTGAGAGSAPVYAQGLQYRAFGGMKAMTYGNNRTLSLAYDERSRLKQWNVEGVLGWEYRYDKLYEDAHRVTYAKNISNLNQNGTSTADPTLDRSFEYDHVGRLMYSHSGVEARMHVTGQPNDGGGYGPYAHHYYYDVWGNVTGRLGWGGENPAYTTSFDNKNQRAGLDYDEGGNVTFDGGQNFSYDATGQQTSASNNSSYALWQGYNGDRLRVKKTDQEATSYYLRSSVLGGQVVAEVDWQGTWQRGYVYLGGQMLAMQSNGVKWVHQDPVVKSQRLTDANGVLQAVVELDPWGGETTRSWQQGQLPQRYTTYLRDENRSDDAQMRRYNRWWNRFDQPDPYNGSYNLLDPQSLNRYSYVQNDPVNFVDPTGLDGIDDDDVYYVYTRGKPWRFSGRGGSLFNGIDQAAEENLDGPGTSVGGSVPQEPSKPSFTEQTCGPFVVPHAATLENAKCIGTGDCVPLVQNPIEILGQQYPGLPHTSNWRQGDSVRHSRSPIKPGTVIATFDSNTGKYPTTSRAGYKHAAIYLGKDSTGIWVIEQFIPLQNIQKRHIDYNDKKTPSNNGNQFSVVLTNCKPRT
jgi:RHS repeat-associated protein